MKSNNEKSSKLEDCPNEPPDDLRTKDVSTDTNELDHLFKGMTFQDSIFSETDFKNGDDDIQCEMCFIDLFNSSSFLL